MRRSFIKKAVLTAALLFIPGKVYAQPPPQIDGLVLIFENVLDLILPLGGLASLIFIIYGGYLWMVSEGDPGRLKTAQGTITWAILGLLFLAIFGLILRGVVDFLK